MKRIKILHIIIFAIPMLGMTGCMNQNKEPFTKSAPEALKQGQSSNPFEIKRGVNISHWLSQSSRRGQERLAWFTEKDVEFIAGIGYDHIRLPIDEVQMWDEQGNKEAEAFNLMHNAIGWSKKHHLKIIIDLHIIRSHHFNREERPLWKDPIEQAKFVELWRALSAEMKQYPTDFLAYELMNEAVTDNSDNWNKLYAKALGAIRENEPDRKVLIGSNQWQSVNTLHELYIPENDKNVILSFHFYMPFLLTHHTARWTNIKDYKGPVSYPGQSIRDEDLEGLPQELLTAIARDNGVYTKDTLETLIMKAVNVAHKNDLQLYCGEWGCLPSVEPAIRRQWYADVREILERHNIAWTNWDYKGAFGIIDTKGTKHDELINVLLH